MNRFIANITHWHTPCYIALNFLVYFFITNGLESADTCVKILVGIILGYIILIIVEYNRTRVIINRNKKNIYLIGFMFFLLFYGIYLTSLPKENIIQSVLDNSIVKNIIDITSIEFFHGIIVFTIFFAQFMGYTYLFWIKIAGLIECRFDVLQ